MPYGENTEKKGDQLCSGMTYCTVGCEFNVSESTVYVLKVSLDRNTHQTRFCIEQLVKML